MIRTPSEYFFGVKAMIMQATAPIMKQRDTVRTRPSLEVAKNRKVKTKMSTIPVTTKLTKMLPFSRVELRANVYRVMRDVVHMAMVNIVILI